MDKLCFLIFFFHNNLKSNKLFLAIIISLKSFKNPSSAFWNP